jgi:hypothetical protein
LSDRGGTPAVDESEGGRHGNAEEAVDASRRREINRVPRVGPTIDPRGRAVEGIQPSA